MKTKLTLTLDLDDEDYHSLRVLLNLAEAHMLDIYNEEDSKPGDPEIGFYGEDGPWSAGAFRMCQQLIVAIGGHTHDE